MTYPTLMMSASFHQNTRCVRSGSTGGGATCIRRSGYLSLRSDDVDVSVTGGPDMNGHAGEQAVAALKGFGVDVMFTLNGGHIWPLYEACRNQGVRVVDTRHEQS